MDRSAYWAWLPRNLPLQSPILGYRLLTALAAAKDTEVPKERAVKVGAIIIRKRTDVALRSAEPLALIAGDPGSYLNGEPTPAGWLVRL